MVNNGFEELCIIFEFVIVFFEQKPKYLIDHIEIIFFVHFIEELIIKEYMIMIK